MILRLKRYSYGEYETEGTLFVGDLVLATIEQPWTPNPNGAKGGKPFESCVPDGMYSLLPFTRPTSGDKVYRLYNIQLGVYLNPDDHPEGEGRDLCLIHKANWASQIQGCIAPGVMREPMVNPFTGFMAQAVKSSTNAMEDILDLLGDKQHILSITNDTGASDV